MNTAHIKHAESFHTESTFMNHINLRPWSLVFHDLHGTVQCAFVLVSFQTLLKEKKEKLVSYLTPV